MAGVVGDAAALADAGAVVAIHAPAPESLWRHAFSSVLVVGARALVLSLALEYGVKKVSQAISVVGHRW
jgi:hypothetical protein